MLKQSAVSEGSKGRHEVSIAHTDTHTLLLCRREAGTRARLKGKGHSLWTVRDGSKMQKKKERKVNFMKIKKIYIQGF